MADVSVIVVNWNTRELLGRCLETVFSSLKGIEASEVLVVDNHSMDGSPDMVASRFPGATLIPCDENLGFARASNLAMKRAAGDYFLLLNSDTEVLGSAIPDLVSFARSRPDAAVIGPQILNPDGTVQSSRRRFPSAATAFLESTVLQQWLPNHPALRRYYVLDRGDNECQEVGWLVGACLLVSAEAARRVGLLDEGYFMYSEELDWCRRFAESGWKTLYNPAARVVHHGGASSGQDLYHRHTRFQHSKGRYFEKFHGQAFAQLLRLFLLANYLYQLVEDSAKLVVLRRNRAMRRQRIATLAGVVGWLLLWVLRWGRLRP